MGLGVLEDHHMEHVPGTVLLDDKTRSQDSSDTQRGLKYDTSGHVPVILVPQPSDDPNDPLNWPLWKRDSITGILCLISVMAVAIGPILAANTLTLSLHFERDFTGIALLTGYNLAGTGVAGVLFVTTSRLWGKRHLFLLGSIILIFSSAWGGAATTYKSFLWARVVQGVAVAPFEALVNACVGDLYFVHQRGIRMALTNMALFGSAFFTPILVGKITHTIGYPWTFYLVAIFAGAILPLVFFFVPETTFVRSAHLNTDLSSTDDLHRRDSDPSDGKVDAVPVPAKISYARSLLPFSGRKTRQNPLKLVLRPFPLIFHPAILWAALIQGTMIGWTVFIGVVLAAIFLGPPLFFDEVRTGYMYTGAFVGALLGFIFSGVFSDWSARYLTRLNKGVYEPEFRIILVIPQFVFGCAGLYGFGATAANVGAYGWFLPDFFFALEVAGMVIGAVASALYIVDAYRNISVEAFTFLLIFKNIFSFSMTWIAYRWILESGIRDTFFTIASIQVVVCLLSIPMYIFGKRNRSFFHRHDIYQLLHLN
ncbi:MAG: hypothetical protein M1838_003023 [Thelocarpon superellum]|nr:MAG: hypothetical protein M1838_003023 [Thelocarpon superellum]